MVLWKAIWVNFYAKQAYRVYYLVLSRNYTYENGAKEEAGKLNTIDAELKLPFQWRDETGKPNADSERLFGIWYQ